jgi:diguanylate cyclase (GGDEF)-like protein
MVKKTLLRTNLIICILVVLGFLATNILTYRINYDAAVDDIETISSEYTEMMYYHLDYTFTNHVNVARTIAKDERVMKILQEESERLTEQSYRREIQNLLSAYQEMYQYDIVFLISAASGYYYNENGLDRIIDVANPTQTWYVNILQGDLDYRLTVGNNKAQNASGERTAFINVKVMGESGTILGVVGVGIEVARLSKVNDFFSTSQTYNVESIAQQLNQRTLASSLFLLVVTVLILLGVSIVVYRSNERIEEITKETERGKKTIFQRATEGLFDELYDWDATSDQPGNIETQRYLMQKGIPADQPYDKMLRTEADLLVKAEFREEYYRRFNYASLMSQHEKGIDLVQYDLMMLQSNGQYAWIRHSVRIVKNDELEQLHFLSYRRNIDNEKRYENDLLKMAVTDEMTGFITKSATEQMIQNKLNLDHTSLYALFMMDIDKFKQVNDTYGHALGDMVIIEVANIIRRHFRQDDLLGRIGGDEFAIFLRVPDRFWAEEKAIDLLEAVRSSAKFEEKNLHITLSIGITVTTAEDFIVYYEQADQALYCTKQHGRDGYTVYQDSLVAALIDEYAQMSDMKNQTELSKGRSSNREEENSQKEEYTD